MYTYDLLQSCWWEGHYYPRWPLAATWVVEGKAIQVKDPCHDQSLRIVSLATAAWHWTALVGMVGIPADQNSPTWTCTVNIGNLADWKMDSLLYWDISLTHLTYMSKCRKSNWNNYVEGFCMWNVCFNINWISPNITHLVLMSWP